MITSEEIAHLRARIVAYIDRRLATMIRAPGTWGSPESLELQALLLLEVRTFALRPRAHAENPYEVRNLYAQLVRRRFHCSPNVSMAHTLCAEGDLPQFIAALRDEVIARLPEEPR
jgi:hypothetical protein